MKKLTMQDYKNVRDTLCLLDSMVKSGEQHSELSEDMLQDALTTMMLLLRLSATQKGELL